MESRLNVFLEFYNITQKELADCTGINRNTIGRYCNNTFESINKQHLDLLCSFFKCSLDDLFVADTNMKIKYPSKITEQAISTIPFSENIIIRGDADDGISIGGMPTNPFEGMSPNEIEEIKQITEEYQMRFEQELKLDKMISDFIDKLIQGLFSNLNFDSSLIDAFSGSKGHDYFTTNLKVDKFYNTFYRFLSKYSDDEKFISIINDIKNIYDNGGVDKLTDAELNRITNIVDFFLNNNITKKD